MKITRKPMSSSDTSRLTRLMATLSSGVGEPSLLTGAASIRRRAGMIMNGPNRYVRMVTLKAVSQVSPYAEPNR